jgi:hypothetical protein
MGQHSHQIQTFLYGDLNPLLMVTQFVCFSVHLVIEWSEMTFIQNKITASHVV